LIHYKEPVHEIQLFLNSIALVALYVVLRHSLQGQLNNKTILVSSILQYAALFQPNQYSQQTHIQNNFFCRVTEDSV